MSGQLLLALLLVLANAFFVAAEFSVARLRPTQAQELLRLGRPGARSAVHAVEHIDAYLAACQLGITLASLGLGAIGVSAVEGTIGGFGLAAAIAFLVVTTVHVVVGELSPKSLAIARTAPVVLALAPVMRVFYLCTKPVVDLFNAMGNLLLKPFGIPPASEAGHQPHSQDELRALLKESGRMGAIDHDEQELSDAALAFGDTRAREAMKPRGEIDFVLTTDSPRSIAKRASATGRTRLPLCPPEEGLDAAVGVINAKDLLQLLFADTPGVDVLQMARPLAHVSESARADEVLREMREGRIHLALVHDEHGTVVGLLSLEDILEELVGEIDDEFDPARPALVSDHDGRVWLDGETPVRALARRFDATLEEHYETTVSGYLLEHLGRVPEVGEVIDLGGYTIEIIAVDDTRVTKVAVTVPEPVSGFPYPASPDRVA